jgi:hypothetical protein
MQFPVTSRAALAALVLSCAAGPALAASGVWDTPLAVTGSAGTGNGATAATPWVGTPPVGARYAEWNFFNGYPVDNTPDIAHLAGTNGVVTETTGGAFLTGGGNIYSFAVPTDFLINTAGLASVADVWLRTATLGTAPLISATLNGVAATRVETFAASLGGFGGDEKEWFWKWSGFAPAATYTFNFTASGSSMSLDQAAVFAAPVPEPGEWAMLLAGLGLVGTIARRRGRREAKAA